MTEFHGIVKKIYKNILIKILIILNINVNSKWLLYIYKTYLIMYEFFL